MGLERDLRRAQGVAEQVAWETDAKGIVGVGHDQTRLVRVAVDHADALQHVEVGARWWQGIGPDAIGRPCSAHTKRPASIAWRPGRNAPRPLGRRRRSVAGGPSPCPTIGALCRSQVAPFKPYLLRRIVEGRVKVSTLYREITAQGFTGS